MNTINISSAAYAAIFHSLSILMTHKVTVYDICCWLALPMAGCRVSGRSLCVQAVCGDLNGLAAQFQ